MAAPARQKKSVRKASSPIITLPRRAYATSVFINCPFDDKYRRLFRAIVFTIIDCGFGPRCALEIDNGAQVRIDKITAIIDDCALAVHDLSRTQTDAKTRLPRFNMPFKLGLFLGAHRFGEGRHKEKSCIILDRDRFRYQKFLSDIAGQDIKGHKNSSRLTVFAVRDWLVHWSAHAKIPGGQKIHQRLTTFNRALPTICKKLHRRPSDLTFKETAEMMADWARSVPL